MKNKNIGKAFKTAFPHTIPIMASFFFLGTAYGIYMTSLGFSFVYPIINALLIFGGSLEFVTGSLLLAQFSPLSALLVAIVIQLRHVFYGIAFLDKYKDMGWKKPYLIFGLCDETFAINCSTEIPEDVDKGWFYFFVTLLNQCYWVIGASTGAILGSALNFDIEGIDFVMTAMFVAIFIDQLRKDKLFISAVIGVMIPLMCLIIFGADDFMLPSILLMLSLLLILKSNILKSGKVKLDEEVSK